MEKTNIGFKAGIILEKLGETGLITIAELARRLNFAADETALAADIISGVLIWATAPCNVPSTPET